MSDRDSTKGNSARDRGTEDEQPAASVQSGVDATTPRASEDAQGEPSSHAEAPRTYGAIQPASVRPSITSQNSSRTPKKPGLGKRSLSSAYNSHRGKEFSVDDSQEEVDQDHKLARTVSGHAPLRRQVSTLRRRPTAQVPTLARVPSEAAEEEEPTPVERQPSANESEETLRPTEEDAAVEEDDDADISDAESFTLKDRQDAINETHPFGIRIWKPALYKKDRSVQTTAEGDIHSTPGGYVSRWLFLFNILWTLVFGWWIAVIALLGGVICHLVGFLPDAQDYGTVLFHFSAYIVYPFGKYVKLEHEEAYMDEDEGEGRSITEYERWQTGHLEEGRLFFGPSGNGSIIGHRRDSMDSADENDSLLGRPSRHDQSSPSAGKTKKRPFGRGRWTAGRVVYFAYFYVVLTPMLLLVSGLCWFLIFSIPMGRVTTIPLYHLRRHPLALTFHSDSHYTRGIGSQPSSVLLCTYRAVGVKYWKYAIDGTNIFLINLLGMVAFTIFDFYVLRESLHVSSPIASSGFIFVLALLSIIPLAYFIGQAVASISAQSTMGVRATVNAFFSTVVEVYLYCVALSQGKAQLVEGSIIGSIFAGILALPGISMCFGAIKRKTQRFNVRSAGVTSTMLMFAIIGSFGPTLFYQIYGSHELNCHQCVETEASSADRDCRRCYFSQTPALQSRFFETAVRPYIWFSAAMPFLSYLIGLLFTLRTHAAIIWNNEPEEKRTEKMVHAAVHNEHQRPNDRHAPPLSRQVTSGSLASAKDNIRDTQLYKRILGQSLKQSGLAESGASRKDHSSAESTPVTPQSPYMVPPKSSRDDKSIIRAPRIPGLSTETNNALVRQVAELAATAATVAARDATRAPRKASQMASTPAAGHRDSSSAPLSASSELAPTRTLGGSQDATAGTTDAGAHTAGGHDAPNWSRTKSAVILLTATVAYAVIAEILVDTVDSVLAHVDISEKFLGITLFALVPNTTEFLNAISFAMNGNIALGMEIGSAYALQVMLLQVPALVLFSALYGSYIDLNDMVDHTFSLIFPQWDMVTVILGLFLMNYVIGEGKSNYFKGSMLLLTYLVIIMGFWFTGYNNDSIMGINRSDTSAINSHIETFKTVGRATKGWAY